MRKNTPTQSIVSTFFIGLVMGAIVACGLSLFMPLTSTIFIAILIICIAHWIGNRSRLKNIIYSAIVPFRDLSIWSRIFFLFIGFVVLYHASSFSSSFDQFLYHQQHIKWLQEYGVVKGLANLHTRFGFNSSSQSITALFAYHPNLKISFTALNGLAMFIFTSWLSIKIFKTSDNLAKVICLVALLVFSHFFAMELSSTSTDILVNIIVAYLLLLCLFEEEDNDLYLSLAILPIFCITLKLSSALIIIISLYAYYHLINKKEVKFIIIAMTTSVLIMGFWIAQNILLTGYVVFPFPDIDFFSFDWKVPTDIVLAEKIGTYNWAREASGEEPTLISWIPNWWMVLPTMNKIVYLLAIFVIILSPAAFKKAKEHNTLLITSYITAISGTIFGMLTAPALRFSLGFVLSSIVLGLYLVAKGKRINIKILNAIQLISIAIFVIFHVQYIGFKTKEKIDLGKEYVRAQYVKPFPLSYASGNTVFDVVQVNGIDIFVPPQGSCYDHKLPCTVGIFNNLELRGKNIKEGFRIKQE